MKLLKQFMFCLAATLFFMGNSTTVFATGLAGDEVVSCDVKINVADFSGNYDGDAITLTFKDVTGTVEQSVELTKENSWGTGSKVEFSLPAPTTYNITVTGVKDGYALVDTVTKEEIKSFAASEGIKDFMWSIITVSDDVSNNSTASVEKAENEITGENSENIKVTNNDAEAVYKEFLESVSFIETDSSWYNGASALLNQYGEDSINKNTYSKWYADYVQGGTVEEYFSLSSYEQFLWTESYTRLAYAVGGSNNFDQYFRDENAFRVHVTNLVTNLMHGNDSEKVIAAYEKLMAWQFEYVKANGVPFNFISNRNYIEEIKEVPVQEAVKTEEEEIEETLEEIVEDEEEGVWDSTFGILAENAITILILGILGVTLAIVVYKRKQKNIDG